MRLFILLLVLVPSSLFSQRSETRPGLPYLQCNPPGQSALAYLPLKDLSAEVDIVGPIADVRLTQTFTNNYNQPIEVTYVFPGSTGAAVHNMQMIIGDRVITAEIAEKQQAKAKYEKAKKEGYRASLLSQTRPNVFQMEVANIMPGDIIQVTVDYTEYVKSEAGVYQFVLPTTIGKRYSGENYNQPRVKTTYLPTGVRSSHPFGVNLTLATPVPIQQVNSPSHRIDVNMLDADFFKVTLNPTENYSANKDFVFEYQLRGERLASGILQHTGKDENFFMLQIQPPKKVRIEEVPPREYLFVIDVSGSMAGYPLRTAKSLLEDLLLDLRPQDVFNVIEFEFGSKWLFNKSQPASHMNIFQARRFIRTRGSGGGTNLNAALNDIYRSIHSNEIARSIVVITDGQVEAEQRVFQQINDNMNKANVFAFGIGSAVNRHLIEGIAHAGMGQEFIVTDQAFASKEARKLAEYINRPALTDVRINFGNNQVYEINPLYCPDVLSDRPLTVFGKYYGMLTDDIVVTGITGQTPYREVISIRSDSVSHGALPYLWARNKLKDLTILNYENTRNSQEITALGLKYHLLTANTSFVAVDSRPTYAYQPVASIQQPLPVPQDKMQLNYGGYRSRLNATGAVSRAVGIYGIELFLPSESDVTAPITLLRWDATEVTTNTQYTVTVKNIFDQEIFRYTTSDSYLWLDLKSLQYNMNMFIVRIESGDEKSKSIGIKADFNPQIAYLFDMLNDQTLDEYLAAIDQLNEKGLIVDAITLLEIAIRKFPEETKLIETLERMYIGNALIH